MLTLIGLGPTDTSDGLSLGAWNALKCVAGPRFARTRAHPAVAWLESEGGVTFDAAFDSVSDMAVAEQVLEAARLRRCRLRSSRPSAFRRSDRTAPYRSGPP